MAAQQTFAHGYGMIGMNYADGTQVFAYACHDDQVGFLIGHRGATIRMIKGNSGAHVQVHDPEPHFGRPTTWFVIQGFPHQCQAATRHMNQILGEVLRRDSQKPEPMAVPELEVAFRAQQQQPRLLSVVGLLQQEAAYLEEAAYLAELEQTDRDCTEFEDLCEREDPVLAGLAKELNGIDEYAAGLEQHLADDPKNAAILNMADETALEQMEDMVCGVCNQNLAFDCCCLSKEPTEQDTAYVATLPAENQHQAWADWDAHRDAIEDAHVAQDGITPC
jgi:hypothetical protein